MSMDMLTYVYTFAKTETLAEQSILACIAFHSNKDTGTTWLSRETIAHECRCTVRTVELNVKALKGRRLLAVQRGGKGPGDANRYRILGPGDDPADWPVDHSAKGESPSPISVTKGESPSPISDRKRANLTHTKGELNSPVPTTYQKRKKRARAHEEERPAPEVVRRQREDEDWRRRYELKYGEVGRRANTF